MSAAIIRFPAERIRHTVALERPTVTTCHRCGDPVDPRTRCAVGEGRAWHVECWALDMGVKGS